MRTRAKPKGKVISKKSPSAQFTPQQLAQIKAALFDIPDEGIKSDTPNYQDLGGESDYDGYNEGNAARSDYENTAAHIQKLTVWCEALRDEMSQVKDEIINMWQLLQRSGKAPKGANF